jgi:YD repeat-containing protein
VIEHVSVVAVGSYRRRETGSPRIVPACVARAVHAGTTLVHDPADKCLSRQVASGLLTTHTYDPAGWLREVRNVKPTGALQNLFTYTYDRVGNRTTETALDGAVTSWTYDRSFQLTGERRGGATGCQSAD